jgi:uncharacterized protein YceK
MQRKNQVTRSNLALTLAIAIGLSGCAQVESQVESRITIDTYMQLSEVSRIQDRMDCSQVYPLVSDAYSAARMNGFYCVTGLRANFRIFKIFDDPAVMLNDTELYEPLQTGGRKLLVGKNWFVYGLAEDIEVVTSSPQVTSARGIISEVPYSTKQSTCMGLLTSALDFTFNGTDQGKETIENAEENFPGAEQAYERAVKQWGDRVAEAYSANNGPLIEQTISEASLSYRDFCLSPD